MEGFPPAHCRVIASQSSGDHAYVLMDTGSPGRPYLYAANCYRKDGRWFESGSSNGPGWQLMDDDDEVGTLTCWGDLAPGVDAVRIEFAGTVFETPAKNGAFLITWWRVPCPDAYPRVVALWRHGGWRVT